MLNVISCHVKANQNHYNIYSTSIKVASIRRPHNNVSQGLWKNLNPYSLPMGMQNGAATLENSMEVPQTVKHVTNNSTPCTNIYLKN